MARNAELVRQWEILRDIDGARHGIAVAKLAAERGVCERTIRRDIDALCRAASQMRRRYLRTVRSGPSVVAMRAS